MYNKYIIESENLTNITRLSHLDVPIFMQEIDVEEADDDFLSTMTTKPKLTDL